MRKKVFIRILMISGVFGLFVSCSSAPKVPPQVYAVRNEAGRLIQLGAKALREDQNSIAHDYYAEAYRLYTSVDESEGRIRALDGLGRVSDGGFDLWLQAGEIAEQSGDRELVALASLLQAEYNIHQATALEAASEAALAAVAVLRSRLADKARALRIYGSAERKLERYQSAMDALQEAAALDLKNKAYIEYASDQYLIAGVYSKLGRYEEATTALHTALEYDRRSENPGGIASNYAALALVAEKAGQVDAARTYYLKAYEVYKAARMDIKAEAVMDFYKALE